MRSSDGHSFGGHLKNSWKLLSGSLLGCLLLTTLIPVCLIKSSSNSIATTLSLQLLSYGNVPLPMIEQNSGQTQGGLTSLPSPSVEMNETDEDTDDDSLDRALLPQRQPCQDEQGRNVSNAATSLPFTTVEEKNVNESAIVSPINEGQVHCDFTVPRSDTCQLYGDIRVISKSSAIVVTSQLTDLPLSFNSTWKIRPYPRKWESTMDRIRELTISLDRAPPRCSINHTAPAVVFSTGGFVGNYFHDFTDVIIPLFMTARRFSGDVHLLVADYNPQFMAKYHQILRQLSRFPPVNLDADEHVLCFPQAYVGLHSHRALGIDSAKSPNGISMLDFRDFLRNCFGLKRNLIEPNRRVKPRLLLILRKGSRAFINEKEVIRMVKGLGFKLTIAGPEETRNISRFAQTVNSVDVLMGVHGAGLTNMVFLPRNATLVQIIPCCELAEGCRYIFAEPAPDMGIKYVEYEIDVEESSLRDKYPRDHVMFKDPLSIQKKLGFNEFWNIFLNQQKGLRHQREKLRLWSSSLEMTMVHQSDRMKMMNMEMKMLDGFLLFCHFLDVACGVEEMALVILVACAVITH